MTQHAHHLARAATVAALATAVMGGVAASPRVPAEDATVTAIGRFVDDGGITRGIRNARVELRQGVPRLYHDGHRTRPTPTLSTSPAVIGSATGRTPWSRSSRTTQRGCRPRARSTQRATASRAASATTPPTAPPPGLRRDRPDSGVTCDAFANQTDNDDGAWQVLTNLGEVRDFHEPAHPGHEQRRAEGPRVLAGGARPFYRGPVPLVDEAADLGGPGRHVERGRDLPRVRPPRAPALREKPNPPRLQQRQLRRHLLLRGRPLHVALGEGLRALDRGLVVARAYGKDTTISSVYGNLEDLPHPAAHVDPDHANTEGYTAAILLERVGAGVRTAHERDALRRDLERRRHLRPQALRRHWTIPGRSTSSSRASTPGTPRSPAGWPRCTTRTTSPAPGDGPPGRDGEPGTQRQEHRLQGHRHHPQRGCHPRRREEHGDPLLALDRRRSRARRHPSRHPRGSRPASRRRNNGTVALTVPPGGTAPGRLLLLACADADGGLFDEADDCAVSAAKVAVWCSVRTSKSRSPSGLPAERTARGATSWSTPGTPSPARPRPLPPVRHATPGGDLPWPHPVRQQRPAGHTSAQASRSRSRRHRAGRLQGRRLRGRHQHRDHRTTTTARISTATLQVIAPTWVTTLSNRPGSSSRPWPTMQVQDSTRAGPGPGREERDPLPLSLNGTLAGDVLLTRARSITAPAAAPRRPDQDGTGAGVDTSRRVSPTGLRQRHPARLRGQ